MLKITQVQKDKHEDLCARFKAEVSLGDYKIVPQNSKEADMISAYYGSIYIGILPDGSSHS